MPRALAFAVAVWPPKVPLESLLGRAVLSVKRGSGRCRSDVVLGTTHVLDCLRYGALTAARRGLNSTGTGPGVRTPCQALCYTLTARVT